MLGDGMGGRGRESQSERKQRSEKGEDEELLVNQKVDLPASVLSQICANGNIACSQTQNQTRYWPTPSHHSHPLWRGSTT